MRAQDMISTHPHVRGNLNDSLIRCIEECYTCAQVCTSCADACLAEPMVQQLTQCIRLNLDCADVCNVTGRLVTRRTGQHEHCRICAAACRDCMEACEAAGRSMAH